MIRQLYIITVLILVTSLLLITSCGGDGDNKKTPTPTPTSTPTPSKTPKATVTPSPVDEVLANLLKKAADIECLNFEMQSTSDSMTTITKVWQKDLKQRIDTIIKGSDEETDLESSTIMDANTLIMYYIKGNKTTLLTIDQETAESALDPTGDLISYNPMIIATDTYDGMNCTVIEYTTTVNQIIIWLWNDYGLPVKVESTYNDKTTIWEYKNITFDCVPDSTFELPEGVEIQNAPS